MKKYYKIVKSVLLEIKGIVLPKKILPRFILIVLVPLLLLQVVIGTFFYNRHWDTVRRRLANDVVGEIEAVIQIIQDKSLSKQVKETVIDYIAGGAQLHIAFYPNQEIVAKPLKDSFKTNPLQQALTRLKLQFTMQETAKQEQDVFIELKEGALNVLVPKRRFFTSTVLVFLLWMIGSFALLFVIAFFFLKNQIRSIERLSVAAQAFGKGMAEVPFKPEGAAEVRNVGFSFLKMKERISRYVSERTRMLAGVSHDLKTPLTRMRLQLSLMGAGKETEELLSDISEMEKMLSGYLDFAKGQSNTPATKVNLKLFLEEIIEKLTPKNPVLLKVPTDIVVSVQETAFKRVITNILSNAEKYATHVQVQVKQRKEKTVIEIDDDGTGIPEEKRELVFRPFYRLDESRNSATGGVGLGLSIARDIILAHGGRIYLSDSKLGGLKVTIEI